MIKLTVSVAQAFRLLPGTHTVTFIKLGPGGKATNWYNVYNVASSQPRSQ